MGTGSAGLILVTYLRSPAPKRSSHPNRPRQLSAQHPSPPLFKTGLIRVCCELGCPSPGDEDGILLVVYCLLPRKSHNDLCCADSDESTTCLGNSGDGHALVIRSHELSRTTTWKAGASRCWGGRGIDSRANFVFDWVFPTGWRVYCITRSITACIQ